MKKDLLKFLYVLKLVWIERMAYRINFLLEVLSGIVSSLILVFLWLAVYKNAGKQLLGGYSVNEMVTYVLGGGLINTFILNTAENPETSQSIQDGTLSGLLVQPINPYAFWFIRDLGTKIFFLLLGLFAYIFIWLFFRVYIVPPAGAPYPGLFMLSILTAIILQFLLFQALSLLAFWMENTYGIRFTMRVIMEVTGGAIVPLSFFPGILQKLFEGLPFAYLIYLPLRIYLGKMALAEMTGAFLTEFAWIAGLAFLNAYIWRKGIRQYVSMGD